MRGLKKNFVKGPNKLFLDPPKPSGHVREAPKRSLKPGYQWCGTATGNRARVRNLKKLCKPSLDSKVPETVAALQRIYDTIKETPHPELAFLSILSMAQNSSDESSAPLTVAIDYILKKWSESDGVECSQETKPETVQESSSLPKQSGSD